MNNPRHLTIKMNAFIAFLIVLFGLNSVWATDVLYHLQDFNASPATNRTVTLQPMTPFPGNLQFYTSDTNGNFIYSNQPAQTLFNGVIKAPPGAISFQIFIPSSGMGYLSATNFLATGTASTYPAGQVAPTFMSAFALFALNGTVQSNMFYPLFSNPSNYWSGTQITNLMTITSNVLALANIATSNQFELFTPTNWFMPATNTLFQTNYWTYTNLQAQLLFTSNQLYLAINATTNGSSVAYVSNLVYQATNTVATLFGFATPSVTNGLASITLVTAATNGVTGFGYVTQTVTNGLASITALTSATNNALVLASNYTAAIANSTSNSVLGSLQTGTNNALMLSSNLTFSVANSTSNSLLSSLQTGTNNDLTLSSNYTAAVANATSNALSGALIGVITNATNNQFVPINQGPFYNTNVLVVSGSAGGNVNVWSGTVFTNVNPAGLYLSNNGSIYIYTAAGLNPNGWTNNKVTGIFNYTQVGGSPTYINYQFSYLQPASANLTNWSTTTIASMASQANLNSASNAVLALANTNQYLPGANVTLTTNSGNQVTIASTGGGGVVNASQFIATTNGGGFNLNLTNFMNLVSTNTTYQLVTSLCLTGAVSDACVNGCYLLDTNVNSPTWGLLTNNCGYVLGTYAPDSNVIGNFSNSYVFVSGAGNPSANGLYSYNIPTGIYRNTTNSTMWFLITAIWGNGHFTWSVETNFLSYSAVWYSVDITNNPINGYNYLTRTNNDIGAVFPVPTATFFYSDGSNPQFPEFISAIINGPFNWVVLAPNSSTNYSVVSYSQGSQLSWDFANNTAFTVCLATGSSSKLVPNQGNSFFIPPQPYPPWYYLSCKSTVTYNPVTQVYTTNQSCPWCTPIGRTMAIYPSH